MMVTRAYGYIRLSKDDQGSTSPARQRERIERLCRERGWKLAETFEDIDVSAFSGKQRPAFGKMMRRLGDVDAIVFWRLDRLSRSVLDFSKILDETQRAKVRLVSTDQPIDTSSAMGKAFVQITSVFAELEAGTISERSRQMHQFKRANGEPVGRVPFGWRRAGKQYEPDPEQQAVLVEAAGRFADGETFSAIARDFGMQTGVLSRILQSDRVLDALPDALAAPLAEAIRDRKRSRVPTSKQSLLGGIATCGECGATMTVTSTRAGRNGRWFSYGCRTTGHVHISARWLDGHVSAAVLDAIDTGALVKRIQRPAKGPKALASREVEARLALLEDDFDAGLVTRARFVQRREGLLRRLDTARKSEGAAGVDLPRELAEHLAERWPEFDSANRRRIVAAVLERVEVKRAKSNGPVDPKRVRLVWRGQG